MNERKENKIKMRKNKSQNGITLIALIITIVVLLILAAVAIASITNDGVLSYAENATTQYNQAVKNEQDTLEGYIDYLNNHNGGTGSNSGEGSGDNTGNVSGEIISKETDYTGYYADVDGDGNIDGIIYADLAVSKSGTWENDIYGGATYSYNAKSTLNNYVVRDATKDEQELFKGATAKVISPVDKVEVNDRFYVMALEDFNSGTYYCWYAGAFGNMNDYAITSVEFGTGKANTATMIGKWNAELYGGKNNGECADMWGVIQNEIADGWFVPSKAEWAACANAFSINSGNYTEYGLSTYYWSSSQNSAYDVWYADFNFGCMNCYIVNSGYCVRLATTF